MRATRKGAQKPDLGHMQFDDDGCERKESKSRCGTVTMQWETGIEMRLPLMQNCTMSIQICTTDYRVICRKKEVMSIRKRADNKEVKKHSAFQPHLGDPPVSTQHSLLRASRSAKTLSF